VSAATALDAFADLLLRTGRRCFMVKRDDGEVVGLITPQEVREIDRSRWPEVRVADAMRPLQRLRTVSSSTPVMEVLKIMSRDDVNQLPVMADGHFAGIITRSHVLRFIQTRAELNV
jgi:CBS domain-containing protein